MFIGLPARPYHIYTCELCLGQCNGDGPYIGVPIDEISSWDPAHHQQEHEKPIQKSIYSYKLIP